MKIPEHGMKEEAIFETLEAFRKDDLKWKNGRAFGYVFDPGKKAMEIGKKAYAMYLSENGLDFSVFKSLLTLEKELAAFAANHLRGDRDVVGNFTSGGTESIILAVKAARDYYRVRRPDIHYPEMILPTTGHAAFHKAAHYLGIKIVPVPVDPATFRADASHIESAVSKNTIMVVGSAPSYAHGVIDPILDMAKIAQDHDLWMHTDACMGGFLLPYLRRLGRPVPDFDFRVPGVSSISVDLHKYAYTPKGASLVLYRNKDLRKHQIFTCANWVGYTMVNNAIQSSKSGGPMAAAWAVLNYVGDAGYLDIAKKKLASVKKIAGGIEKINDLRLMTRPDMTLVSFTSDTVNIFHIIDEMNRKGWYIQPALAFENSPAHVHLSVSFSNVGTEDAFLRDLERAVSAAKRLPEDNLAALVKGDSGAMDLASADDREIEAMLSAAGLDSQSLPGRTAGINSVLNSLPPDIRERLLTLYVNRLFSQP